MIGKDNRKRGVMAGLAVGDALGAGYEFLPPIAQEDHVADMIGGGIFNWEPGEWTDDTSMAFPLAAAVADGRSLMNPDTIDWVYQSWRAWAKTAKDVGNQTRRILTECETPGEAEDLAQETFRSGGGNGCVMRTAPIALAFCDGNPLELEALLRTARIYARLTHAHPTAMAATLFWVEEVRYAIRHGAYSSRIIGGGPSMMVHPRRYFENNGSARGAVNAAVSAIRWGNGDPEKSLKAAVAGGGDTDTVAAIVGSLVGAVHGLSGLPERWLSVVHGWPGISVLDLPTVS